MKTTVRGLLRWLIPGMRVKRWILLAVLAMALIVVAVLCAFGVDLVRALYRALPPSTPARGALIAGLAVAGICGFGLALWQLVRSIARGVAPGAREKASTLIYRTRILDRGPNVVAIGGGTGLSTLLRGLKEETSNITAVVTVTDDGGSSGRLRQEIDVLPPGDVRNCILALAEDETELSTFLQYRFAGPHELAGHSLGNLLLSGLEQATGGFDRAVEAMSHMLSIRGDVLPATLQKTHLVASMEDGTVLEGETRIVSDARRIRKLRLSSPPVKPYERVLQAIAEADMILLGPGSLFTSLVPNLLVDGIAAAIETAGAEKLLVGNLMTQPGETDGFTLGDHLRVLNDYIDVSRFDALIANAATPSDAMLVKYRDEAAEPVVDDVGDGVEFRLAVVREDLLGTAEWSGRQTVKHSPTKLARTIVRQTRTFSHRGRSHDATP
jgi:uncharacterized cofD-like protein